jgi:serine/threonine protein kinase
MALAAGTHLGRYEIRSLIGKGGMGEVYLAQDTQLRRAVAIKVLPPQFTRDEERLHRFEQEARAASALNHPYIITIHEIGAEAGTHFIVTELITGKSLRDRMREGRMKIREALDVSIQVLPLSQRPTKPQSFTGTSSRESHDQTRRLCEGAGLRTR